MNVYRIEVIVRLPYGTEYVQQEATGVNKEEAVLQLKRDLARELGLPQSRIREAR